MPTRAASDRDSSIFMAFLGERNRAAAIAHVIGLVDAGLSAHDVVTRILAPAQREVGRLWEIGEWSIAQEHIATGITDDVLHAVSQRHVQATLSRGHIIVACMEGEYHAMPARMLVEVLRGADFGVTFVGASLPPDALSSLLQTTPTLALAISCSLTPRLLQVAAGIDIAHAYGVPVLCGGAAFGTDGMRAEALGGDAWAADASGAISIFTEWAVASPDGLNVAHLVPGEELDLIGLRASLVEKALAASRAAHAGDEVDDSRATAQLRHDIGDVIDHLAVAVRLRDVSVLSDFLSWSVRIDATAPTVALALLTQVLPNRLADSHRLLSRAHGATLSPFTL